MTSTLNPYIGFSGNAREAMEFYRSVFGGELNVMSFGDVQMPGAPAEGVMHAQLETPAGFTLMGSDSTEGDNPAGRISISLSGTDPELRTYFDKLSEGGTVTMPLQKQAWGDEFGMLTDKYGVAWMANIGTGQG